jgi:hypothetical protein
VKVRTLAAAVLAAALFAAGCASSKSAAADPPNSTPKKSAADRGNKILTAVVTEREFASPGSAGGGSYAGSGSWYLSFEAQDGDRTVHYRFSVTRNQYFRYPEGSRVQLVLLDDQLREIRPSSD